MTSSGAVHKARLRASQIWVSPPSNPSRGKSFLCASFAFLYLVLSCVIVSNFSYSSDNGLSGQLLFDFLHFPILDWFSLNILNPCSSPLFSPPDSVFAIRLPSAFTFCLELSLFSFLGRNVTILKWEINPASISCRADKFAEPTWRKVLHKQYAWRVRQPVLSSFSYGWYFSLVLANLFSYGWYLGI